VSDGGSLGSASGEVGSVGEGIGGSTGVGTGSSVGVRVGSLGGWLAMISLLIASTFNALSRRKLRLLVIAERSDEQSIAAIATRIYRSGIANTSRPWHERKHQAERPGL
jgi:hypothetical protein